MQECCEMGMEPLAIETLEELQCINASRSCNHKKIFKKAYFS